MNNCKDCCFSVPSSGIKSIKRCHRYPPTVVILNGSVHAYFPIIDDSDWCGEFQSNTNIETSPSFEKFYSTVKADILCSCGDILQSRQQVYLHWQQDHIS